LYATMTGAIADFQPSFTLLAIHVLVPLATIPIFLARSEGAWSIAGPILAALFGSIGYHLTSQLNGNITEYRRASEIAKRQADELRLAQDLHDVVGSTLGTVKAYADMLAGSSPTVAAPLSSVAQGGLDDLRAVLDALAPPCDQGLASTVAAIARRMVPTTIELGISGAWPNDLAGPVRVAIARIVQESLYNAVRHGTPTHIEISCSVMHESLSVVVRDNGCGFEPEIEMQRDGRGLATMQSRASQLAGSLAITSNESGTVIAARFPLTGRLAA
jgi:signal transduction histidine kinase